MKLHAYPDYRECKLPWLRRYPNHWSLTRTKHVCKFTTGWTPPTGDSAAYDGDCPWANISDLGQRVIFDTAKTISAKAASEHGLELIPSGSLMFSFKLSVGQVAFAGRPMFSNEAIASFRESSALALEFAYYAFPLFLVESASENIYGAKLLNQSLIRDATFPLPPKEEQEVIASFLDRETAKIDALIAEQERLLGLLAEKRQAVISHAVTKGLNPDAPMKDSGVAWLGEVPAHWTVSALKRVSPAQTVGIVVNPSNYVASDGLPFIYGGDIREGCIDLLGCRRISPEDSEKNAKTRLEAGDLLTVRVGAPGVTAVVPLEAEGGNCASVMLIKRGDFDSRWLCYTMNDRVVRFQVEVVQYGAAQEQFNISHAMEFLIPVPSRGEQSLIADYLDDQTAGLDQLAAAAKQAIGLLAERRSALIAATVTGQIDVREAA